MNTTTAYKLTDLDGYTRKGISGETFWAEGEVVHPTGVGTKPCGPGVLHAYISPEVAVLGNPAHASIITPRCFEVELEIRHRLADWRTDGFMRWIASPLKVVREVPLPALSMEELVAWAICVSPHESTRAWALKWLSGEDRSWEAAESVTWGAWATAKHTNWMAQAAAWAAQAAAEAAKCHQRAVHSWAAESVSWAAWAAKISARDEAERNLNPALERARTILNGNAKAETAFSA
jgi:hypothetical protein